MVVILPASSPVGPQPLLDIHARYASSAAAKSACCSFTWSRKKASICLGAMREGSIQLGHAAQQLGLVLPPAYAPTPGATPPSARECPSVACISRRRLRARLRVLRSAALDPWRRSTAASAAGVLQRFERRLDASHDLAIELHLLAHVPVERARDQSSSPAAPASSAGRRARGFTVPIDATLASAASRACTSGIRSGSGIASAAEASGCRARTRSLHLLQNGRSTQRRSTWLAP